MEVNKGEIRLVIDYSQTIKQMIAAGKYDWEREGITEKRFPLPAELFGKQVSVSTKLFHFNKSVSISSKKVISRMDKEDYRPATIMELLALGFKYPELQREFPIIALGSIWRRACFRRYVPYLYVYEDRRGFNLASFIYDWNVDCRFLGVHK